MAIERASRARDAGLRRVGRNGFSAGSMDGALCLAALFSRRQHARMPLLILGVGIAEPPPARRAVHSRRMIARLIVRRHALTQALQFRPLRFFFFHRHASCRHSTRVLSQVHLAWTGAIRLARKEIVVRVLVPSIFLRSLLIDQNPSHLPNVVIPSGRLERFRIPRLSVGARRSFINAVTFFATHSLDNSQSPAYTGPSTPGRHHDPPLSAPAPRCARSFSSPRAF